MGVIMSRLVQGGSFRFLPQTTPDQRPVSCLQKPPWAEGMSLDSFLALSISFLTSIHLPRRRNQPAHTFRFASSYAGEMQRIAFRYLQAKNEQPSSFL